MICRFLVYMLLHGKHPVPARTIHEHIWPEEDIENAGKKIKSLAYRLQNVFAVISDYRLIISTPMGYQINPELDIITDMQHFEEYWLQAQNAFTMQAKIELLKKAVELYRGHIYDSAGSEHWLMSHSIAYKYKCLSIYTDLMRAYYETQDYATVGNFDLIRVGRHKRATKESFMKWYQSQNRYRLVAEDGLERS